MTALQCRIEVGRLARSAERAAAGFGDAEPSIPLADGPFERFRRAVEARAGHRFHGLRVEVLEGVGVVLYGRTDCYYAKQLAQHVIGELTGLRVLANRIRVLTLPAGGGRACR
jgi:hypothetical protein